jgi:hypothetical protein
MDDVANTGDTGSTSGTGQFSAEHQARRLAARRETPKRPAEQRPILRQLVLFGLVVGVALVLMPFAESANSEYPEVAELSRRLSAAYESVWRGDASIEEVAVANDLDVAEFPRGDRVVSVLYHREPTEAGWCYGLRIGGGIATVLVKFAATDGCVPQGHSSFESAGSPSDVLPPERLTRVWFVPAMIALLGAALAISTEIVLKLLARRRGHHAGG